jgi:hypothetical protein
VNTAALIAAAFVALYASHMLADHIVQTDRQANGKTADKYWVLPMAGHLTGYLATQALALAALQVVGVGLSAPAVVAGLAFSVATHGLIDRRWPVRWLLEHTGSAPFAQLAGHGLNGMYLADQSLHVGCLFVSALLAGGLS